MARTKEAVRRAQRLGPDRAAAEERCRRRRAAIAKAARVMSVEEVEIATIEREVVREQLSCFFTSGEKCRIFTPPLSFDPSGRVPRAP